MSNPFKPTPRVLELLGYCDKKWIMGCRFTEPRLYRSYNILTAGYGSGIRNPSEREISHLLTFDLVEETPTPGNHDTYDTTDPKHPKLVGLGMKLTLTALGKRLLEASKV